MSKITTLQIRTAYIAIVIGVVVGIFSFVRLGSILVAAGTIVIALANSDGRRIERYLPLAIGVALLALAIALPKGL